VLRTLDLANLPDADVVALALEGRDAAHRELIKRYERPVFSLVFRMVRDRELVGVLTMENVGEFLMAHSALRTSVARPTPVA